ncbi:exopolygalacturonase-like [Ananas comosus]|uniref:Exopolygalacturonase n=1 Tax=Ananas comosus TaxID=4615 RepID=A0A6P5H0V3_ANACO|nr:exopolygalacturonase-like [Ananas comosus]
MESFLRSNALRTCLLMKSITAVKLKNEELFVQNVNISFFGFYYYRICQNFLSSKIRTMLGVVFSSIFLVVYIANSCNCIKVYDVTKYGASAGKKDNQAAFLAAWKAACNFGGAASLLIPPGTFALGPVNLRGPCKNHKSPFVEIRGHLRAPPRFIRSPDRFWIKFNDLNELTVTGGGVLDGQGALSWLRKKCGHGRSSKLPPTTLKFKDVSNSSIHRLNLVNSKAFHMNFHQCNHIDVHDLKITAPGNSLNTDGIHVGQTSHISIRNSIISTGDDCISIGPGSRNVTVSNITCGPGHGISVGSLGKYRNETDVIGLLVRNCTVKNTTNGVRIKTWPGSPGLQAIRVLNITFEDITMINISNPIIINQLYCPGHGCTKKPSQIQIGDIRFRRIRGTSRTETAINLQCSEDVPCKNVELDDVKLTCAGRRGWSCSNVNGNFSGVQFTGPCLS